MRSRLKKLLVLATFFSTIGCSTINPFTAIPHDASDFQFPPEELRGKYSDIALYEKRFRGFIYNTPPLDSLVAAWGEPQRVSRDWGHHALPGIILPLSPALYGTLQPAVIALGVYFLILPTPLEHHFWTRGDYEVEVVARRTYEHLYSQRVLFWRWNYKEKQSQFFSSDLIRLSLPD